jgi:hypothetical protein
LDLTCCEELSVLPRILGSVDDTPVELEQAGFTGGVAKVARVNNDLQVPSDSAAEAVDRRLNEAIPISRCYLGDGPFQDEYRDA